MRFEMFERVVLAQDLPADGLKAGDVGVIVEEHPAMAEVPDGYELEIFAATGETLAVVSVPATSIRKATEHDVLSVRHLIRA